MYIENCTAKDSETRRHVSWHFAFLAKRLLVAFLEIKTFLEKNSKDLCIVKFSMFNSSP